MADDLLQILGQREKEHDCKWEPCERVVQKGIGAEKMKNTLHERTRSELRIHLVDIHFTKYSKIPEVILRPTSMQIMKDLMLSV